jgi:phage FluMu protein Com
MARVVNCQSCGARLRVADTVAEVKCPKCKSIVAQQTADAVDGGTSTRAGGYLIAGLVAVVALAIGATGGFVVGDKRGQGQQRSLAESASAESAAAKDKASQLLLESQSLKEKLDRSQNELEEAARRAADELAKARSDRQKAIADRDDLSKKLTAALAPKSGPQPPILREKLATATDDIATIDFLTIAMVDKKNGGIYYNNESFQAPSTGAKLAIEFKISVNDAGRQFRYKRGDSSRSNGAIDFALTDDLGNTYRTDVPPTGTYFVLGTPKGQVQQGMPLSDYVIFEKPVPAAKLLKLQLAAKMDDGTTATYVFPIKIDEVKQGQSLGMVIGQGFDFSAYRNTR